MSLLDEQISGAMVRSHVAALREKVGDGAYEAAFASLKAEERDELTLPTPLSWVRIQTLERLYAALAAGLGMTVEDLHTEIASRVVGEAVKTVWRALLHIASDEMLIGRAPPLFRKAYRQGRLEVTHAERGSADLAVFEWPGMSEFALRGFRVGLESTLRAAGRRDPRASAIATRGGAVLKLEWRR
jgi:hypothetical protein